VTLSKRALKAMWAGDSGNESQLAYSRKLREVIREIFAPSDAVPLVQCMNSYEPVHTVSTDDAKSLVESLWTKPYSPYEHQYQMLADFIKRKDSRWASNVYLCHYRHRFR